MWLQKINANIFKRKNKCYPSNRLHKYYLWTDLQNIFKSAEEQLASTSTSITKPHDTATHVVVVCPISKMQELPLRGLLRSAGQ